MQKQNHGLPKLRRANERKRVNTTTAVKTAPTQPKRYIGIRPRVKVTAAGDPHPTQVVVLDAESGETKSYELGTERDELDFILGKWPMNGKFRDAKEGEDFSVFLKHHIIVDDPKEAAKEELDLKPTRVPVAYDGLRQGDLVAMSLGGMGDCLAYAISRFGEQNGFNVLRLPPFRLKDARGDASEDNDALLLATLVRNHPELFRDVAKRGRALIKLREVTRLRRFVQEDRKACLMRVWASTIGDIFCSEMGGFPDGDVEKLFNLAVASDPVAKALVAKERTLNRQVEEACEMLPIYADVLSKIEGVGPQTMAPVISTVQDIGLFDTVGKFKAFCGLHLNGDGSFPRQRRGVRCNWNPSARQAFFNLGNMSFMYLKGCFWGIRLRENKAMYRVAHPYPVLVEGKYEGKGTSKVFVLTGRKFELVDGQWEKDSKKGYIINQGEGEPILTSGKQDYTKAHIHKMAVWRTVSEFAEWLYWKWRTMEGYGARPPKVYPPEDAAAVALSFAPITAGGVTREPPVTTVVSETPVAEVVEPVMV